MRLRPGRRTSAVGREVGIVLPPSRRSAREQRQSPDHGDARLTAQSRSEGVPLARQPTGCDLNGSARTSAELRTSPPPLPRRPPSARCAGGCTLSARRASLRSTARWTARRPSGPATTRRSPARSSAPTPTSRPTRAGGAADRGRRGAAQRDAPALAVARRQRRGAIARLLLTIPSYAVQGGRDNPYGVVYRDLIAKLPAETELVILTHDGVADSVRGVGDRRAARRARRGHRHRRLPRLLGLGGGRLRRHRRRRGERAKRSSSPPPSRATATRSSPTRSAPPPASASTRRRCTCRAATC